MGWDTKLGTPFKLVDGRTLVTLSDARELMLGLPERHQRNAHWQYAGEMLLKAAEPGKTSVKDARAQLQRALKAEGLIG